MKKIVISLIASLSILSADISLSKKLIDNDINAEQYQLFVTKTVDIELNGLKTVMVFSGSFEDYNEKFSLKKYSENIEKYRKIIDSEVEPGLYSKIVFANTLGADENDGEYVQVLDYYDDESLKTRVIKLILADDDLSIEEQNLIFATTYDTSYHYNDGKVHAMLSNSRELNKFNKEQKQ